MLGLAPERIHLFEGHVGGGFGIRGELYPEDLLVLLAARRFRTPGQVDRGPPGAPDGRQPGTRAAPPRPSRGRRRGAHPRPGDRNLARPGRLSPHPRGERAQPVDVLAARSLPRARLPGVLPRPPDQQGAGRDLPRARAVRVELRPRTADGRRRAPPRHRSRGDPPAQPDRRRRIALHRRLRRALRRDARPRQRRLSAAAPKGAGRGGLGRPPRRPRAPPRSGRDGGGRRGDLPRGERPRPVRRRQNRGGRRRRGRNRHRRRLGGAGVQDGDGPDLRRRPRRRLSRHRGGARADRPHSLRHRRACRPRDGDDRKRGSRDRARGAGQGTRGRVRAAADACRAPRDPGRRRAGRRRRPVDPARRDRACPGRRRARRGGILRDLPMHLPLRRPHRGLPGRSRHRGGDGRAVPDRLRRRAGGQRGDAGGPARRRLRPGDRRRALRGVRVRRGGPAARRHPRRLPAADRRRGPVHRVPGHRGRAEPAQPARHQGGRRGRHQRGRRGDRQRRRRGHRHPRRHRPHADNAGEGARADARQKFRNRRQ